VPVPTPAGYLSDVFRTIAPIFCGAPVFTVTDMESGQVLPNDGTSVSYGYVDATLQPLPSGDLSNTMEIYYFRAGHYRIRAAWNCLAYVEYRYLEVTVTDDNPLKNPSLFTMSNLNNCPSPYTGFTINRTNPSNPITKYFLDISQCDASGNITPNGQYWLQPANGINAAAGWYIGNMTSVTPALPSNFFVAGRYYKVKLAVSSKCVDWQPYEQILQINNGLPSLDPQIWSDGQLTMPVSGVIPLFTCKTWGMNPWLFIPSCASNTITNYTIKVFTNASNTCNKTTTVTPTKTYLKTAGNIALKTDFPVLATQGSYTIEVTAATALGSVTKSLCVNVSDLNSEFGFCKLSSTSAPCNGAVSCEPRTTSTFASPTIMGAYSIGICRTSNVNAGTVDMVETKIERWIAGSWQAISAGTPALNGIAQIPVTSWLPTDATKVLLNPINYNGWFTTNYTSIIASPINNKFRLTFRVHNAQCGWTPAGKESIGYFTISNLGGGCRTIGNGDASDSSMPIDADFEAKAISFTPNPTTDKGSIYWNGNTNTPASLSVLDISGRVVQEVFTNKTITNGESFEVNLADLPNGIYIYRLNADKVYTGKISKN
jgi:hypothetical protein